MEKAVRRGRYGFRVRAYECGPDGEATLPAVCDYLQEAASRHAEELGFSRSDFAAGNLDITWVLARMFVKVLRYPKWNEEVSVETFPRGGRRIVAWRDFEIKDASGATIALATSDWMTIDLSSRRLAPIPANVLEAADSGEAPVFGEEPYAARLRFPENGGEIFRFKAMKAHIDLNGHVNNAHYVEWLLEPAGSGKVSELEIAFKSETLAGEEVCVQIARNAEENATYHRVFAADGRDHAIAITRPAVK